MSKRPSAIAFGLIALLTASPAFAAANEPSPTPLPINSVTVDVRRHHAGTNTHPGEHVERPFGPHGTPRKPGHGHLHPRPTPTPTPTP